MSAASGKPARFKWSASRLKRLLQCPRQFRYVYVERLPQPAWAPLAFGKCLHETISGAHEMQMSYGTLPALDGILGSFGLKWEQALEAGVSFRPSHPAPERYETMGREMLRLWYRQERDAPTPLAVEMPFEVEITDSEGTRHLVRGIVDRLDETRFGDGHGALTVIDYKSGSRKATATEVQNDLQFALYALAVEEMLGLPVARVECRSLKDGATAAAEIGAGHVAWIENVLSYAQGAMDKGDFPACPGYWCAWCDFQSQCQDEGVTPGRLQNASAGQGGSDGQTR